MTIFERISWLHRAATTLQTDDLVALKWALKQLITDAELALEQCRYEIKQGGKNHG